MAGGNQWVAGGELGSSEKCAQDHKQIILDILEDGENVTKALKRLKPPVKRAAPKRKTRAAAKKGNSKAEEGEDDEERQEKDKQFNLLTEAAGELMSLGFEDIYQDSKSNIAANLHQGADQGTSRGGVVWHDDGTVKDAAPEEHAMYQRNTDNATLGYNDSAQAAVGATDQPAVVDHQQIPTPVSAVISEHNQSTLKQAEAQSASAVADPPANADATEAEPHQASQSAQAVDTGSGAQSKIAIDTSPSPAIGNATVQQNSSLAGVAQDTLASTQAEGDSASAVSEQSAGEAQPSEGITPPQSTASDAGQLGQSAAPAAGPSEDSTQAAVGQAPSAAPAVVSAQEAGSQPSSAKAEAPNAQPAADVSTSDVPMPDSKDDSAVNAAAPTAAPAVQSSALAQATASTENAPAQGRPFRAKGPGLGESREFTGGPMNFERPKYRHAPYGPPPVRGGPAGGRFGFAGGRSSPRGRASPTGNVFGRGRGSFNEPPRSSTMRPQYGHHPPMHMPQHAFPPPQHGGYPPHPPPPQHQPPYYPPPQQAYPPPTQPPYPQYPGQQGYPAPPQQPPPAYHDHQYAVPGQPPQYGAPWQQHQGPQDPHAAYHQPPAYPAAHFPPSA